MPTYQDADLIAFRAAWREAQPDGYVGLGPVDQFRAGFDAQNAAIPVAEGCKVEPFRFGDVAGEQLTPANGGSNGVLLYLHGGGHVFGSALSHRHLVSRLADAADMVAYVPDHRLAPEHPFPAGLDDAAAVLAALRARYPDRPIVLAGESAGGNLAAALVVRLLAEGASVPDRLYLLSPWLDMTQSGASISASTIDDLMISGQSLEDCAIVYATDRPRTDPRISPLFADVTGFPPVLLHASSDEVLLSDTLRFAERLAMAHVEVTLHVQPEMVHAWPLFHHALARGRETIVEAGRWLAGR